MWNMNVTFGTKGCVIFEEKSDDFISRQMKQKLVVSYSLRVQMSPLLRK